MKKIVQMKYCSNEKNSSNEHKNSSEIVQMKKN